MTRLAEPPHGEAWLPRTSLRLPVRPLSAVRAESMARTAERAHSSSDSWPNTARLLPWSIAGFLALIWLTPIDAITLPEIPLPVEATLDRVAFIGVAGLWLSWFLVGRARGNLRARFTVVDIALATLLIVSVLSVVNNAHTLFILDELELSIKKIAILVSLVLLYYVAVTGLRASEIGAFQSLLVVLAALAALGVIYEYRSGVNVFYDWSARLLPGIFAVEPAPFDPQFGRELITGPTAHAIAIATMLAMALPFAFTGYMRSGTTRLRVLHAIAITLILAGCIATVRRTGALGPAAALVALVMYRPRKMLRLLPLGLLVVMATQVLAPDAPSRVKAQFANLSGDRSVQGRTSDYDPVKADIRHALLLGRGYGSFDPIQHRFLDNEWLGRLVETGVIGALAYLFVILAMMRVAHRAGRSKDPIRQAVGISAVAAVCVYAVTNLVFDALAFSQVPYMLFFVGALATVALDRPRDLVPVRQPEPPVITMSEPRFSPALFVTSSPPPDLSVVMVTHNGRERALTTLRSARRSVGMVSIEWFVVDCGSSDDTADAIEAEFEDITVIRRTNVGFAAGNNVALAHARGRYILLLNPDVEIVAGQLSNLVARLDDSPEVAAASVIQRSPDGTLLHSIGRFPSTARQLGEALALSRIPGLGRLQEMEARPGPYSAETSVDWLVGAFLIIRGDVVDELGGLDERFFLYSEEKDYCYRIREAGWEVRHLTVMEIVHHTGGYEGSGLLAQLTHSKVLFAKKHCGPGKRLGIRGALVLRHGVRMVALALSSGAWDRRRARHEAHAFAIALGLAKPPFDVAGDRDSAS